MPAPSSGSSRPRTAPTSRRCARPTTRHTNASATSIGSRPPWPRTLGHQGARGPGLARRPTGRGRVAARARPAGRAAPATPALTGPSEPGRRAPATGTACPARTGGRGDELGVVAGLAPARRGSRCPRARCARRSRTPGPSAAQATPTRSSPCTRTGAGDMPRAARMRSAAHGPSEPGVTPGMSSTSTRSTCHGQFVPTNRLAARGVQMPASTPDPLSRSAAATSTAPSSCQLTLAQSGPPRSGDGHSDDVGELATRRRRRCRRASRR